MEQRICPVCRTEFIPTHHNQRFCPPSPGKGKSKCAKAYENAKRRGTLDALLKRDGKPGEPFDCQWCGKPCIPGSDVPSHATRFCSADHKKAWHKEHVERKRLLLKDVITDVGPHGEAAYRKAMQADPCAYCGAEGGTVDHIEPRKGGGADDTSNLTGACAACNNAKFTMPMLLFLGYRQAREYWRPWQEASAAERTSAKFPPGGEPVVCNEAGPERAAARCVYGFSNLSRGRRRAPPAL